jgi:hypothetical protein
METWNYFLECLGVSTRGCEILLRKSSFRSTLPNVNYSSTWNPNNGFLDRCSFMVPFNGNYTPDLYLIKVALRILTNSSANAT